MVCAIRDGHPIRVTISLGVSVLHPQSEADAYRQMKQLISQSDQAMYLAKQSGRNQTRLSLAG